MGRKLSPGVHNIRIKKPGGGTRMQRVKVLKSGKFKFIKNVKGGAKPKAKTAAKPRGKAKRTSPGRSTTMARRKMSLQNRIANTLLFILAFARPIQLAMNRLKSGGNISLLAEDIMVEASAGLVGRGGKAGAFDAAKAAQFYGPPAVAFILFEIKKGAMKKFRMS